MFSFKELIERHSSVVLWSGIFLLVSFLHSLADLQASYLRIHRLLEHEVSVLICVYIDSFPRFYSIGYLFTHSDDF